MAQRSFLGISPMPLSRLQTEEQESVPARGRRLIRNGAQGLILLAVVFKPGFGDLDHDLPALVHAGKHSAGRRQPWIARGAGSLASRTQHVPELAWSPQAQ